MLLAAERMLGSLLQFPSEAWGHELLSSQGLSFSAIHSAIRILKPQTSLTQLKGLIFPSMVAHGCNSSTWKIVEGHTWLHSGLETCLG